MPLPATDDKDGRVDLWCWAKRMTGKGSPGPCFPPPVWMACGSTPPVDVATHHSSLEHHVGGNESRTRPKQYPQQCAGDRIGRTGDNAERAMRQPQRQRIGLDHGDRRLSEAFAEPLCPTRVQFHGEHPSPGFDQVPGQYSLASADVHDQLPGPQTGIGDDAPGPLINKWVPAPRSS